MASASALRALKQNARRAKIKYRASALFARLTFVLSKVSKTAIAGRDPPRYSRGGPLRFSGDGAHSPNSLRSDMGCSSTPSPCDARLALRLDSNQRQKAGAEASDRDRDRAKATAKAKAKAKAKANFDSEAEVQA
ncbi:hypothetical protein ACF3M1_05955 [Luteimonas sp. WGS1318]|uniref:hypothetical protein n=1 Tax=Luteimonas sp. WGS1318 TaxID=3366815 RepID=UPI00372D6250